MRNDSDPRDAQARIAESPSEGRPGEAATCRIRRTTVEQSCADSGTDGACSVAELPPHLALGGEEFVTATMPASWDRSSTRRAPTSSPLDRNYLAEGVATRQIAGRLGISYSTVRTHIRAINGKLGANSKLNAVVTARELELVS